MKRHTIAGFGAILCAWTARAKTTRWHCALLRNCCVWAAAATMLAGMPIFATAAEETPPPPYQYRIFNNVMVGVAWDEAVIKRLLPPGITPVAGATGGINVMPSRDASGLGSHSGTYLWVDIEGFDPPGGPKGRWIIASVWDPAKVVDAMRKYYGMAAYEGNSHLEFSGAGKSGVVTLGGREIIRVEIKPKPETCQAVSGTLNYPGKTANGPVAVNEIPYMGEFCGADLVKVDFQPPAGHPMAQLKPVKFLWAGEFKDGNFSYSTPVPAR